MVFLLGCCDFYPILFCYIQVGGHSCDCDHGGGVWGLLEGISLLYTISGPRLCFSGPIFRESDCLRLSIGIRRGSN